MSITRIKAHFQKFVLFILPMIAFGGCASLIVQNNVLTYPPHPIKPKPEKFFIANSYDINASAFRKNKQGQFVGLIEEVMTNLDTTLEREFSASAEVEPGLSVLSASRDSSVQALFQKHGATHGVVITYLDAFFDQTGVVVTETDDGKEREAFYDIVVKIGYSLRSSNNERFDTVISVSKYHSSRPVLSGLLAAGPNIVKNGADAREGILANVDMYMRCFFQQSVVRMRNLHVKKEFKKVGDALKEMNDLDARIALLELAESADAKIASTAKYNYAVLLERDGEYDKVKQYLQEALRLRPNFPHAREMLKDYQHQ